MSEIIDSSPLSETVGISPGVGILGIFRYIKYKTWFALAEYIDNAIDSYLKNSQELEDTYFGYQLMVDIEFNLEENYIKISDNAAGISGNDLERALRMAVRPRDRSGLSEFGMGMKAASCWFSPKWSVETQALGDNVKRKVIFDVQSIVETETEVLSTNPVPSIIGAHFTNIHLAEVYSMPNPNAITKIREHLTSIYRGFLRDGKIVITVNSKQLKYKAPSVLTVHPHTDKDAAPIEWRKELDFTCAGGQRVTGFAAIYPTAKTKEAGFALLRRGRVVEGSFDEPYRPTKIFGTPGSFHSQRIYGELNLDNFTASFTKDGVQWEDAEDDFLSCLKAAMKSPGLDLLKQASGMRVKESTSQPSGSQNSGPNNSSNSTEGVRTSGSSNNSDSPRTNTQLPLPFPPSNQNDTKVSDSNSGITEEIATTTSNNQLHKPPKPNEVRKLSATIDGINWSVFIELSHNPAHTDWMIISKSCIPPGTLAGAHERHLGVRVSLVHPFTTKYCSSGPSQLEPLLRLGTAFALAKTIAQEGGVPHSSVLMDYVNELLLKL